MTYLSARNYLELFVVGQKALKDQIAILMEELISTNFHLLLRAPSGYGKTYLAYTIGNYINYRVDRKEYYYYLCERGFTIKEDRRIHLLDEAHQLNNVESIYPFMDQGDFSFIICTNEYDELKEPLSNRCFGFHFDDYSTEEIKIIISKVFEKKKMFLPDEFYSVMSEYVRGSPRDANLLAKRLYFTFKQQGVPKTPDYLNLLIFELFRIEKGGLTYTDKKYMRFLESTEYASLDTICNVLNVPKSTVREEIEPFLIKKGIIKITPRGRKLC